MKKKIFVSIPSLDTKYVRSESLLKNYYRMMTVRQASRNTTLLKIYIIVMPQPFKDITVLIARAIIG